MSGRHELLTARNRASRQTQATDVAESVRHSDEASGVRAANSGPWLRTALTVILPAAFFAWLSIETAAGLEQSVGGDLDALSAFFRLLVVDRPIAIASLVVLLIAAAAAPILPLEKTRAVISMLARNPLPVAGLMLVLLSIGSLTIYHSHPLSMDEYAPLFQAKAFARGSLTGQLEPSLLPRLFGPGVLGFFFTASVETGRVISNYWPGHALLLTPFTAVGVPWLLNPLIAATSLLLIHSLTRSLTSDPLAPGWALAFSIASPAFVVNGMSFYSMPAHLLAGLLFVLLLLEPTAKRTFVAGVVGSVALTLHNPFAHVVFAAPWVLWLWYRHGSRAAATLLLGYVPLVLLLGFGWLWLRLQVQASGFVASPDAFVPTGSSGSARLRSFLDFVFTLPGHQTLLARAAEFIKIWVWAVPALPALALLGLFGARRSTPVRLLAVSAALTLAGYLLVYLAQGHGWGSRYFHPAWMVLPLFAAMAVTTLPEGLRRARERLAGALALGGLLVVSSTALVQVHGFIHRHLAQLPISGELPEPVVVLLDPRDGHYVGDLIQNDPMLRRSPIILLALDPERDRRFMAAHFPALRMTEPHAHGTVWSALPPGGN